MASPSSRKRSISDLLNGPDQEVDAVGGDEPSKTRRRVDAELEESSDRAGSTSQSAQAEESSSSHTSGGYDGERLHHPAFLAYPDVSNPRAKSTPFQQPNQLITFSYTPDHVQEFTDSALRYYNEPPMGSNLSYGYDRWIRKPDDRGRIDALLKAISRVKSDPARHGALPEIGVVSWRGVMTKYVTSHLTSTRVDGNIVL